MYPNNLLPSDHLDEQVRYCSALLDTAKKRNGVGITVPPPDMSTAHNGNPVILEYIRQRTAFCPRDFFRKIPPTLINEPQYPRLYSVYHLIGAKPMTVVLERRFYDTGYEDIRSARWIEILQNGCYGAAMHSSPDYPRGSAVENRQTGVLQFAGEVFSYEMLNSDQWPESPGYEGFDRTRKWYVQLFAPQKSVEELFSREAAEYLKRLPYGMGMLVDPNWYCQIAFD